jgi:phage minor structural protein
MSLYVFNNQQKVTKVIKYKRLVEATQEIELNGTDELTVEIPNKDWNKLEEEPLYLAVRDTSKRFSFHMYKILQEDTQDDTVTVKGIQIGYDEMKAYGYIQDRRFTQASMQSVANAIVDGTDWQVGFVDSDLAAISTNFYYISRLEAIRKVIEANGCEIRFRVEITGNRIVAKRIDFLKRMSSDKGKRFSYGSKLLSVVKEKDSAELYTALVGRGKGEEVGDGYGRRIGFEDVEWSIANGDPADKPIGQEFVELPDMTALYGFPDGEPRTNVAIFEDTEDETLLLQQTYEQLVNASRPQVQFKATVQLIGDVELGETVSIIRHDLNFKYKTRVFKIKRDLLNNKRTEVELGDRITESLGRIIKRIDTTNQRREDRIVEFVQNTADGKNRIFRQAATPDTGMTLNDLWYKPVGEGETELYRWNGNIWQLEKVSAGLLGGTLDAENGDVNLINVNVASIVGETSEFVRSAWNAIGAGVTIDGNGFHSIKTTAGITNEIKLTDGQTFLNSNASGVPTEVLLDGQGLEFTTNRRSARIRFNGTNIVFDGASLGMNRNHINSVDWIRIIGQPGETIDTAIFNSPNHPGSIIADTQQITIGMGSRESVSRIAAFSGTIQFMRNLHMNGNNIQSVSRVALDGSNTHFLSHHAQAGGVLVDSTRFTIGIGSHTTGFNDRVVVTNSQINLLAHASISGFNLYRVNRLELDGTNGHYMHLSSGSALVDSRMVTIGIGSPASIDRVADFYGRIDFYKNLNMNGNVINNQSDGRYKTIKEHVTEDILGMYKALDFIKFEYTEDNMPEGEHFGLVAQDAGKLGYYDADSDRWMINSSDQIMYNSLAVKQLVEELDKLKERMGGLQ